MHIQSGQKLASTTSAECPSVVSDDYNNGLKFRLSMIARIIKADIVLSASTAERRGG